MGSPERPAGSTSSVQAGSQSLERGLLVLRTLAARPEGLLVSEVSQETGLHRSIVNRALVSLFKSDFATRDGNGRYRVGPAVDQIAGQTRPRIRDVAEPVLQDLALRLGATASLVEVMGASAVATVVAEPSADGPWFSYRLGNRDPLDRGAGGLAALAACEPSPQEPPRVNDVRRDGYVVTEGELNSGALGLAAPITNTRGLRASVNVVTNSREIINQGVPAVLAAAQRIANAIG